MPAIAGMATWRDLGAGGQIELEIAIVHLGDGRRGIVVDCEQADALQAARVGLEAGDIGGEREAIDFLRDVVDLDLNRVRAGRGELVIGDSLMDGADEMRTSGAIAGVELETELAGGVSLGAAGNVHAAGEVDEDNLDSGGGLVVGAVGDGAGEGLGVGSRKDEYCRRYQCVVREFPQCDSLFNRLCQIS